MAKQPKVPLVVPPVVEPTTPPPVEPPKTFTQEELDRIIKERIGREQARFADYDDLKKDAEELSKLKEADLSEQEKLNKRIAEMEKAATDREAKMKAQATEVNEKLVRAEVRMVAATMDFIKPEQAYKLADLTGVETDEDGQIKGVKKALEKLAKDNQHLIKAAGAPGSPPNKPGKKAGKDEELEQAMAEARVRFNIKDYSKQPGGKD